MTRLFDFAGRPDRGGRGRQQVGRPLLRRLGKLRRRERELLRRNESERQADPALRLQLDPDDRARRGRAVHATAAPTGGCLSRSPPSATATCRPRPRRPGPTTGWGSSRNTDTRAPAGTFTVTNTATNGLFTKVNANGTDVVKAADLQSGGGAGVVDRRQHRRERRHDDRAGLQHAAASRQHRQRALELRRVRLRQRRRRPPDGRGHVPVRRARAARGGDVRRTAAHVRVRPLRQSDAQRIDLLDDRLRHQPDHAGLLRRAAVRRAAEI